MYLANLVEVKGDISLESVQVYPGGMGTSMNFPSMGVNMSFGPPSQAPFGGGLNVGFGFPSAPSVVPTPPFAVSTLFYILSCKTLFQ